MSSVRVFTICLAILLSAGVVAADNSGYQKGTLIIATSSGRRSYNLKAGGKIYQISNCGDFQDGQEVEFLLKEDKIYIAHEGAKAYKCSIESTTASSDPNAAPTPNDPPVPIYMKGTILGYSIRRDLKVGGGGGAPGGMVFPASSSARKAKVYELQGPELIYKEYGCQLEGTRKPDAQPGAVASAPVASSAAPATAAAPSTARLSIASAPDGADIEIDGNFVGNTPSDLEVQQGERSIVVKKSGYKDWERKMKVLAGSSIHLNAEMEKSANP